MARMAEAICLQCGNKKSIPWKKCRQCRYDPRHDADPDALVKSVYLSVGRYDDQVEQVRYRSELDDISIKIERGEQLFFSEVELVRLRKQKVLVESIPDSAVLGALIRLFLPAVGFIALMFGLIHLLSWK
jgi:hypothetical protein